MEKKKNQRGERREREGTADLFHSCERCACNANSLHPSRLDKTARGVSSAGLKRTTCHFSSTRTRAGVSFWMILVLAARAQKHDSRARTVHENYTGEPILAFALFFIRHERHGSNVHLHVLSMGKGKVTTAGGPETTQNMT